MLGGNEGREGRREKVLGGNEGREGRRERRY